MRQGSKRFVIQNFQPEPDHRSRYRSERMYTAFQITPVIHKEDSCVATHQKAVYNWYETHHSDDEVVDIYSPEWQERIKSWHALFETYCSKQKHSEFPQLHDAPEDLELGILFFTHPIATFSFRRVFEAFYTLDTTICGTSSEANRTLATWREMKPFKYLKSGEIKKTWSIELKKLDKEIRCGDLAGERLRSRIYGILCAVERLEYSLESLEGDLGSNDGKVEYGSWMLDMARKSFDERCTMIADTLKTSVNGYILSGVEGSYDGNLGSST